LLNEREIFISWRNNKYFAKIKEDSKLFNPTCLSFSQKVKLKHLFLEIQRNDWVENFHLNSSEGAEFKY
jgi:hypothetical protein